VKSATYLPPFWDLPYAMTAVVVDDGDWSAALSEAGDKAKRHSGAGLAFSKGDELILITNNGTTRLGTATADDIGDLIACFSYLLLDGRMFDDISESCFTLTRLARLYGCKIVLLIPRDAMGEIKAVVDCATPSIGPVH